MTAPRAPRTTSGHRRAGTPVRAPLGALPALLAAALLGAVAAAAGCADGPDPAPAPETAEAPGLPNLVRAGDDIWSGGQPDGDEGFDSLRRLGVRTIVSTDGARPDVERAEARGMRYVHVPIGYDGVPPEAGRALARVARELPGPYYVHCHHGVHRGPAAAAILWMERGADARRAEELMETAGTARHYPGLWRDVRAWRSPPPGAELPALQSVSTVDSFTAQMADIDRTWDRLKLLRDAGWTTRDDHPDLEPAHEALMLWEGFREAGRRVDEGSHPGDLPVDDLFVRRMGKATALAEGLRDALEEDDRELADTLFRALRDTCKSCHHDYRD